MRERARTSHGERALEPQWPAAWHGEAVRAIDGTARLRDE
ncbi:hypothetical protein QFZ66_008325 [Streptomyces sp. B4I13]|nr:hypothetical protein [Streptomyces sp. B4I13]